MININLLPEEYRKKKIDYSEIFNRYKTFIAPGLGILVAVIIITSLIVVVYPSLQKRTLNKLSTRWKNIEKDYEEVIKLKKEEGKFKNLMDVINKIIGNRILWARRLNDVSDSLPKEIQLTELTTKVEKIKDKPDRAVLVIAGIVPSDPGEQAIGNFIKALRGMPGFTNDFPDIEPPSAEALPSGLKKFSIKCYTAETVEAKKTAPAKKKEDEAK